MKSSIKFLIPILSFVCINFETFAQRKIEIKSEADLKNALVGEIVKHNDTLSKYVKTSGILFFRFLLNKEGLVDSIKCSEKQPTKLITVLTETIATIKFPSEGENSSNKYYVLPILYDYQPEAKMINSVDDLNNQVQKYDLENLNSYLNFDFNGFLILRSLKKNCGA